MQLNPQQLSHLLAVWPVARLASVGARRQPHLIPIVFVCVDGVIYSPVDGKPKRDGALQRLRNVAQNVSVSVLLDHYDSNGQRPWWLRIDGEAAVESVEPVLMTHRLRFIDESTERRNCGDNFAMEHCRLVTSRTSFPMVDSIGSGCSGNKNRRGLSAN